MGDFTAVESGMILAGSIVGSGELVPTRTGAEAGFHFLWLIIIGCVIKVFTQIELARYTDLRIGKQRYPLRDLYQRSFSLSISG